MRFTYRATGPITAAAILILVSGCSRTQQDWRAAQQAGTPQAYEVFAKRHPDSELAGVARQRMAQLTEEAAWRDAERVGTAAAYQDYLAKYPNGSWSQDARIRMESRSLAAQPPWDGAPAVHPPQGTGPATPPGSQLPSAAGGVDGGASAAHRVTAMTAATAHARTGGANAGRSAVQLGAFSSIANARSAWSRLSTRFGPELRGLTPRTVPVMSSGRRLYRLEVRVADQTAARRLCRQLQQRSQGCLPVP